MNPLSKGFGTSEFASMVAGIVVSGLITFGVINADQAKPFSDTIGQVVTGVVALITIWGVISQYIHGRNQLKTQALQQGVGQTPTPNAA